MGSLVVGYLAEEDPITVAARVKVLVFHPFGPFLGVSSFGPSPQHAEDEMVDFLEGFFARYVLVIACPSLDDWDELDDQPTSGGLLVVLEDGPHFV